MADLGRLPTDHSGRAAGPLGRRGGRASAARRQLLPVVAAWLGALGYLLSSQRNGLVLWSAWAPVMAIGGAMTLGMGETAATRPIWALAILAIYALMIVGQAALRRRGSPSTLDLLTSRHGRGEVPEEKSDNPQ